MVGKRIRDWHGNTGFMKNGKFRPTGNAKKNYDKPIISEKECPSCGSKTKSNRACVMCRNHLAYNGNQ